MKEAANLVKEAANKVKEAVIRVTEAVNKVKEAANKVKEAVNLAREYQFVHVHQFGHGRSNTCCKKVQPGLTMTQASRFLTDALSFLLIHSFTRWLFQFTLVVRTAKAQAQ